MKNMNIIVDYSLLFIYLVFSAYSFGLIFNKNIYESLAPSILLHTFITLLFGIVFNDLRIGMYLVILFYLFFIIYRHIIKKEKIRLNFFNYGFILFTSLYIFLCILNFKREFFHWDEFSHWGMFIKESFRLNKYFSLSNIGFSHKDYISFTSITIYIFLKIVGRYTETICYTGMTVFLFSLIMSILSYVKINSNKFFSKETIPLFFVYIVLLSVPYFFATSDFYFFISIMPDFNFGIIIFYSLYVSMLPKNDAKFKNMLFILSSVALLTTRMEGIAYYPLILAFYIYNSNKTRHNIIKISIYAIFSIAFWFLLRKYIGQYIDARGIQSFDSFSISEILNVFTLNDNVIPYIKTVLNNYIYHLFHTNVFIYAPFIHCYIFLFVVVAIIAFIKKDINMALISVFILGSFAYKIVLQFFLYSTRFGEGEATQIASYGRYMTSFVVAFVYFDLLIIVSNFDISRPNALIKSMAMSYLLILLVSSILSVIELKKYYSIDDYKMSINGLALYQYTPGLIKNNHLKNKNYINLSKKILEHKNSRVVLILNAPDRPNMWERINVQYQTDGYAIDLLYLSEYKDGKELINTLYDYDFFATVNNSDYLNDNYFNSNVNLKTRNYNLYPVDEFK